MLSENMKQYIKKASESSNGGEVKLKLSAAELEYAKRNGIVSSDPIVDELKPSRFAGSYMERGDKETEQMLAVENNDFLAQRIDYFKKNKLEFLYMESEWFDLVGADSVSFESDDVFGKYDVMLGLKLQKKLGAAIKAFLDQSLQHGAASYDLLFSGNEGLWTLNFSLDDAAGFREDMMIEEAFELIYQVLFKLAETVENQQKNNH